MVWGNAHCPTYDIPPQIFGSKLRHPQTKVAKPVQVLGGLNSLIKEVLVVVSLTDVKVIFITL